MSAKVKVSGAWKDSELRVKVSGAWKNVEKGFVKVAGVWETFLEAVSGWSIAGASYDSVSFSVSSQETFPTGVFFKPDGTKMYILGDDSNTVYQYTLSTAWDISTASYDSVSFSVSSQEPDPRAISFKPDGIKMYIFGLGDTVYQYTLSTAWDISTASYDSVSFSTSSEAPNGISVFFKPDGTKMYMVETSNSFIYQYTLSTAWDISTASYDSVSYDHPHTSFTIISLAFSVDGDKLFIMSGSQVFQHTLSTAWDISTASYDSVSFNYTSEDSVGSDLSFKPDGTKMYILGNSNDSVYQYSL